MIYAKIDIQGRAMLQSAMKTAKSAKQYRRYKAVDLSSQGYEVPAIAKLLTTIKILCEPALLRARSTAPACISN